jgi:hypothetical protein
MTEGVREPTARLLKRSRRVGRAWCANPPARLRSERLGSVIDQAGVACRQGWIGRSGLKDENRNPLDSRRDGVDPAGHERARPGSSGAAKS